MNAEVRAVSDVLADGLSFLDGRLRAYASTPVLYSRGDASVQLPATFGNQLLKLDDGLGGVRMEWTDLDFGISAADLVLSGQPTTPLRGDLITVTRADGTEDYEVLPYGGDPPWRWLDPHHSRLLVHTKHVEPGAYY